MPRDALFQFRNGTAADWTSVNPVLAVSEPGFENDTGKFKIGDGTTAWNSLPYAGGSPDDDSSYVVGPGSATDLDFVQFDGTTGKLVKDGGLALDTDGTLAADSDSNIPSQKAVKTYVDAVPDDDSSYVVGPSSATDLDFAQFDGTTGKLIKDGGLSLDTNVTLAADSDSKIPSQKAVKTYVDTNVTGAPGNVNVGSAALASGQATVIAPWVHADAVIVALPQSAPSTAGTTLYADPADIVVATSFKIKSDDATDARDVFWMGSNPPHFALRASSAIADAFVNKDLGSDQSDVWLTFDLGYHAAAATFWSTNPGNSGDFADMQDGSGTDFFSVMYFGTLGEWLGVVGGGSSATPSLVADTWQTCEMHYNAGVVEFYIGGTLLFTNTNTANVIRKIQIGQVENGPNSINDPASIAFFKNIKVGTTRGATDLFADDFSTGDLSLWTTTSGDVSVIAEPF